MDDLHRPAICRLITASADAERCKDEKLAAANEADWTACRLAALRDAAEKAEASRAIVAAGFRALVQVAFDNVPLEGEETITMSWADYQRVQDRAADVFEHCEVLS